MNLDQQSLSNEEQFLKKLEHRRKLAKLPIEEKLKKLVKLQSLAYTIGTQQGRAPRKPWGLAKQTRKINTDQP